MVKIASPVISVVLLVAVVALALILLFAFRKRKSTKSIKLRFPVIYDEPPLLPQNYSKNKSDDPMEFPRSRLHIFSNRVLGEWFQEGSVHLYTWLLLYFEEEI